MRALTKRFIAIEVILTVLFASRLLLGSLGAKLNADRVMESARKLERIPKQIAGWEWDRTVTDDTARIEQVTGGGWNLFVRCYVRADTGEEVYFQVCRWLDPLTCYELHGWRIVGGESLLTGEQGRSLKAVGVREGWIEKNGERMAILFWESDLLDPELARKGALTEETGAKGRLSRLWGRTQRRIRSFFRKSGVVAKVIYPDDPEDGETRDALAKFTSEVLRLLPKVLK